MKRTTPLTAAQFARPAPDRLICEVFCVVIVLLLLWILAPSSVSAQEPEPQALVGQYRMPVRLQADPATVTVVPGDVDISVGETVALTIVVSDVESLYGADLCILFDPAVVQVVDADPGTAGTQILAGGTLLPEFVVTNTADNTLGLINYVVTQQQPTPPVSGVATVGTITFTAAAEGVSLVVFDHAELGSEGGLDIDSVTVDGEIRVAPLSCEIVGQVAFEGRSTPPAVDWICPISVSVHLPGEVTSTYLETVDTTDTGEFVMDGIPPGVYDIHVRDLHSFWNIRRSVTLSLGANPVDMGLLTEGDCNQDKIVNVLDFSILAAAFDTTFPDPGFDPRADLNNSYNIDILDFSILSANFDLTGDIELSLAGKP